MKLEALLFIAIISSIIAAGSSISDKINYSDFEMRGTITNVLTPSTISVDKKTIELDGVDYSGLFRSTYDFLIRDLYGYYIGKQVLVKGNTIYLDLIGSYNSQSINHMIQEEIDHLREEQYLYEGPYGIYSKPYY